MCGLLRPDPDRLPLVGVPASARAGICAATISAVLDSKTASTFTRPDHALWLLDILAHTLALPLRHAKLVSSAALFVDKLLKLDQSALRILSPLHHDPVSFFPRIVALLSLVFMHRDADTVYAPLDVPRVTGASIMSGVGDQSPLNTHVKICESVYATLLGTAARCVTDPAFAEGVGGARTFSMIVRVICGMADFFTFLCEGGSPVRGDAPLIASAAPKAQELRVDARHFATQLYATSTSALVELAVLSKDQPSSTWGLLGHFARRGALRSRSGLLVMQHRIAVLTLVRSLIAMLCGPEAAHNAGGDPIGPKGLSITWDAGASGRCARVTAISSLTRPASVATALRRVIWLLGRPTDAPFDAPELAAALVETPALSAELMADIGSVLSLMSNSKTRIARAEARSCTPFALPAATAPRSDVIYELFGGPLTTYVLQMMPLPEHAVAADEGVGPGADDRADVVDRLDAIRESMSFTHASPTARALEALCKSFLGPTRPLPASENRHAATFLALFRRAVVAGVPEITDTVLVHAAALVTRLLPGTLSVPGLVENIVFAATRALGVAAGVDEHVLFHSTLEELALDSDAAAVAETGKHIRKLPLSYAIFSNGATLPSEAALAGAVRTLAALLPALRAAVDHPNMAARTPKVLAVAGAAPSWLWARVVVTLREVLASLLQGQHAQRFGQAVRFSHRTVAALLALVGQLVRLTPPAARDSTLIGPLACFVNWTRPSAMDLAANALAPLYIHHEIPYVALDVLWSVRDLIPSIEQADAGVVAGVVHTLCDAVADIIRAADLNAPLSALSAGGSMTVAQLSRLAGKANGDGGPVDCFRQNEYTTEGGVPVDVIGAAGGAKYVATLAVKIFDFIGHLATVIPAESGLFWAKANATRLRRLEAERRAAKDDVPEELAAAIEVCLSRSRAFQSIGTLIRRIPFGAGVQSSHGTAGGAPGSHTALTPIFPDGTLGACLQACVLGFFSKLLQAAPAGLTVFPHAIKRGLSPDAAAQLTAADGYDAEGDVYTDLTRTYTGTRLRPKVASCSSTAFDRLSRPSGDPDAASGVYGTSFMTLMADSPGSFIVHSRQPSGCFAWRLGFAPASGSASLVPASLPKQPDFWADVPKDQQPVLPRAAPPPPLCRLSAGLDDAFRFATFDMSVAVTPAESSSPPPLVHAVIPGAGVIDLVRSVLEHQAGSVFVNSTDENRVSALVDARAAAVDCAARVRQTPFLPRLARPAPGLGEISSSATPNGVPAYMLSMSYALFSDAAAAGGGATGADNRLASSGGVAPGARAASATLALPRPLLLARVAFASNFLAPAGSAGAAVTASPGVIGSFSHVSVPALATRCALLRPLADDVAANLLRGIAVVDAAPNLVEHKIGLLFVEPYQRSQEDIFMNQGGSPGYRAFVWALARALRREDHSGWNGRLDNGEYLPWLRAGDVAVAVHDPTLMENDASDEQRIKKKRHVGNDNVVIVYDEGTEPYKPDTLSSQFNHRVITVRPLGHGQFTVAVFVKPPVGKDGALHANARYYYHSLATSYAIGSVVDGAVVTADQLGVMLREVIVSAVQRIRIGTDEGVPAWGRLLAIRALSSKS